MTATDINNPERFVTVCKNQNPTTPILNWTVFNDYIVTAVKEDEALYTNTKWKMPHLLFYCDNELLNQTSKLNLIIQRQNFNFRSFISREEHKVTNY